MFRCENKEIITQKKQLFSVTERKMKNMDDNLWEKTAQFLKELRCEDTGRLSHLQLPEYQRAVSEKGNYQVDYERTINEIKEEQKCIIENYIGLVEQCAEEENQQAYLQGMVDVLLLLSGSGILKVPSNMLEKIKQWK